MEQTKVALYGLVGFIGFIFWIYLSQITESKFDETLFLVAGVGLPILYALYRVGTWANRQYRDIQKTKGVIHDTAWKKARRLKTEMQLEMINPGVELEADARDLEWVSDQSPHMMVSGGTRNGKTNTIHRLIEVSGYALNIGLDPHFDKNPDPMPLDEVYGSGGNYAEINDAMFWILAELDRRLAIPGVSNEPELGIWVDENRNIVRNSPLVETPSGDKVKLATLMYDRVSSEGAKVNMRFRVSTYNGSVKELGIEGDGLLREGFGRITATKSDGKYYLVYFDGEKEWRVEPVKKARRGFRHVNPYRVIPQSYLDKARGEREEVTQILNGFAPEPAAKPVKVYQKTKADEYRIQVARVARVGMKVSQIKALTGMSQMNGVPKTDLDNLNAVSFIEKTLEEFGFVLEPSSRTKVIVGRKEDA